MHKLVTVLVDKKDGEFHKEDAIETFYERYVGLEGERVFDWCEAETAGRWKNKFPDNVLTGNDVPRMRQLLARIPSQGARLQKARRTLRIMLGVRASRRFRRRDDNARPS